MRFATTAGSRRRDERRLPGRDRADAVGARRADARSKPSRRAARVRDPAVGRRASAVRVGAVWTKAIAERLAARARGRDLVAPSGRARARPVDGVQYRFVHARGDVRLELGAAPLRTACGRPGRAAVRPLRTSGSYHRRSCAGFARPARRRPRPTFSQLVRPLRLHLPGAVAHAPRRRRDDADRALPLAPSPPTDPSRPPSSGLQRASPRAACGRPARPPRRACYTVQRRRRPALHASGGTARQRRRRRLSYLYVGRISPEKGTHVLFDALARLAADQAVELDVVGEEAIPPRDMLRLLGGPELRAEPAPGYLEACLARLPGGRAARVRLLGKHPPRAAGLLPRRRHRWSSVALGGVRQARGRGDGLRLAGRGDAGRRLPEVVADGETGVLVPPNDAAALAAAVARLAGDPSPAGASRRGRPGRASEERFSYDRIAGEVEELDAGLA